LKPIYLIILLFLNFCWAGVYSAYKVVALPTGAIVTLRFGMAAPFLLFAWPWLRGPAPRGMDLIKTCALGLVVFPVGQRLQIYGAQLGTAGNSSVLMAVEPLLTSVAAAIFLREHIGPRRIVGFALGLIGVLLLNQVWRPDFKWTGVTASLIFISSFICEAAYSIVGKPIIQRADPVKMLTISLVTGTVANLLIDGGQTLAEARVLDRNGWILLVTMALVCTAFGYSFWFVVIRECPVNVAALTIFAQAAFGVMIAALWLREPLHWGQVWGSAAIVAGLAVGLSRQVSRKFESRTLRVESGESRE
jgi:drug/metabolite transporter (DMT)-like permease